MTNDTTLFLGQWMRSPGTTGAVAPSSRKLAETVTAPVPRRGEPVIVELGPGTGAFTAEIQRRLEGRGHHLAVEINPRLAEFLAARHPAVDVMVADAAKLPQLLQERGLTHADVVVSGLPWAAFSEETQTSLLEAVAAIMGPNTAFTTFAYSFAKPLPPARRFRRRLHDTFEEVVMGRTVWGNLPPAFVYHARRPRS
ncbi:methyltransferase domain-containing protein [Planomonospora sp. ID67723]|uniref:class I SAM-dependent methyltransferase n=1 Tax=Planomonospora sp. ID67723 TaxID=2738134 RepID=UPI0018C3CF94|nr:methyltransferase domain-containing protein [Planomonospora sp. ID67723]MBG0832080.1 methyltransferase domain-containing protein [Planomonospora sp. ID67723]